MGFMNTSKQFEDVLVWLQEMINIARPGMHPDRIKAICDYFLESEPNKETSERMSGEILAAAKMRAETAAVKESGGFRNNVNKLEIRMGCGSHAAHQLHKDSKPCDIWVWYEATARPVAYIAYAIKEDGKYYYQEGDKRLEITENEYTSVRMNPNSYYWSTAFKLHSYLRGGRTQYNYKNDPKPETTNVQRVKSLDDSP
jgi:hypothetical protein